MTLITGNLRDSGNQPLNGELWVTLDAPLRDNTPAPDATLMPVTRKFTITAGALSIDLSPSTAARISYRFQFFPQVGVDISGVSSMDFRAMVPPNAGAIEFADLLPTGITTDTMDTAAIRLAEVLTNTPQYQQALQGGPRYLGVYNAALAYRKGDAAKYAGSWWMWIATEPGSGIQPSSVPPGSNYWLDVGSKGDAGGTGGTDTAYGAGWDGALWAPSANVLYDIISTLLSSSAAASTYAPLNNATFTGAPTRATAPAFGNRSAQLATTQWVGNEFATLDSPTFTGNPAVPLQLISDNSNKAISSAWVRGYIASVNNLAAAIAFSTTIVFDRIMGQMPTQTVSSVLTFTVDAGAKIAGSSATVRLVADGTNAPVFTGFVEAIGSAGYLNINGVANNVTFYWDGVTAFYSIWQAKFVQPTLNSSGLTMTAGANFTNPSANTYSSSSGTAFSGLGGSTQTIPANKSGRIVVLAHPLQAIGFNNVGTAEAFSNWEYYAWNASGPIFSGASGASLDSGFNVGAIQTYFKLERSGTIITAAYKTTLAAAWTVYRTFPVASSAALFVAMNTTSGGSIQVISFEVQP
jgi:hypothetical protein